ncbi:MAG: hypothetical protein GY820_02595, partial [Gammaproteobacteria bacterium]|nr:hypothetical protein [Gammaproteobacteria bacterium]
MNVDQLSRCYAGLSLDGPLQFTHTVRPRRANRKRRAIVKAQSQHSHPHHQMQLRQTSDLDFDGVATSNTEMSQPDASNTEIAQLCVCVGADRDRNLARSSTMEIQKTREIVPLFSVRIDESIMKRRPSDSQRKWKEREQREKREAEEKERRRAEEKKDRQRQKEALRQMGKDLDAGSTRPKAGEHSRSSRPAQSKSPPRKESKIQRQATKFKQLYSPVDTSTTREQQLRAELAKLEQAKLNQFKKGKERVT